MSEISIHYEIKGLRFGQYGPDNIPVAIARGDAKSCDQTYNFELILAPIDDGQWRGINLGWLNHPHPILLEQKFVQALVNSTARLLDTINMWPEEQIGNAAKISLNERVILPEVDDRVIVSFRSNILDMPSADWSLMWKHIEGRAKFDEYFQVLGFNRETVTRILPLIRSIFPNDWVRARYRAAGLSGMNEQFERANVGWFPAYHLARAGHGAICRDPGWNYLIEIGLAIEELQDFDGLDRLKRQVTKSPGTQHHLCLAAELHARGLLLGLEPSTGVGSATNDLLVQYGRTECQIEVKEFSSKNPAKRLQSELADKVRKLPTLPTHPVIFHVVLIEDGTFDKKKEDLFFQAVSNLQDSLSEKISAVVAGRRFVDSRGGRIKRDTAVVAINPNANCPVEDSAVKEVFAANYQNLNMPLYGIGSFVVFGGNPSTEEQERKI